MEKVTFLNRLVRKDLTKKVTRSDMFHGPYFFLFKIFVFYFLESQGTGKVFEQQRVARTLVACVRESVRGA